jgi:hypothetical protein
MTTRQALADAIEIERQIAEILEAQEKLGVHSSIKHAYQGWQASQARHEALVQMLDLHDHRSMPEPPL